VQRYSNYSPSTNPACSGSGWLAPVSAIYHTSLLSTLMNFSNNSVGVLLNGVYGFNLPPWPSKPCILVVRHISLTSQARSQGGSDVPVGRSPPPQIRPGPLFKVPEIPHFTFKMNNLVIWFSEKWLNLLSP